MNNAIINFFNMNVLQGDGPTPPPLYDPRLVVVGNPNERGNILEIYDFDGNLTDSASTLASGGSDALVCLAFDLDANMYIGRANGDIFKIDKNLNVLNDISTISDLVYSIAVSLDNGDIAVTYLSSSVHLRVYDSSFNLKYSKSGLFTGASSIDVRFDINNNVYVAGTATSASGPELYKFDPSGTQIWTYSNPTTTRSGRIDVSSDSNFVYLLHNNLSSNYIAKIQSDGTLIYDLAVDGPSGGFEGLNLGLITDGSDIYYTTGGCNEDINFKYIESGTTLTKVWGYDASTSVYCRNFRAELDNLNGFYSMNHGNAPKFWKLNATDGTLDWTIRWSTNTTSGRCLDLGVYPKPYGINI